MSSNPAASVRGAGFLWIPENYLYHIELELSAFQSPFPLHEQILIIQKSRNMVEYCLTLLCILQIILWLKICFYT